MTGQAAPKDFFVSYNSADRAWAEWIAWELEDAGHSVVIQAWDFRPGVNFVLEMHRATIEADRTVAVLSPNYLSAEFTLHEWAAAFAADPSGKVRKLLPVRVAPYDVKGLIPQIVHIDLVEADEPTARERLLAGVTGNRPKPETRPAFPRRPGEPSRPETRPVYPSCPGHPSRPQYPGQATPPEPAAPAASYLETFLLMDRSPSWDKELCSQRRIENSKLNYVRVSRSDRPVMTGSRETIAAGLPSRHREFAPICRPAALLAEPRFRWQDQRLYHPGRPRGGKVVAGGTGCPLPRGQSARGWSNTDSDLCEPRELPGGLPPGLRGDCAAYRGRGYTLVSEIYPRGGRGLPPGG